MEPKAHGQLPAAIQLRVNLAIVRGHYADAARLHFRSRARAAQFAAIRDIPILISEIERLSDLLAEVLVRHTNLRDAALVTITAYEADEADPLLHIRLALSADSRRRWTG